MHSEPTVLAFDTSAAHCAAALLCGGQIVAHKHEEMARGQAERLMTLLDEVLAQAGCDWTDLDRIGVGVGPGNFTGIRISVSAARGLALGLGIPAIGVNSFDAITKAAQRPGVPCVPAPRGQAYLRDAKTGQARLADADDLLEIKQDVLLLTPEAAMIAIGIARAAAHREVTDASPAPLYIKPADAAPASDPPPVILDATPEVHGDDA